MTKINPPTDPDNSAQGHTDHCDTVQTAGLNQDYSKLLPDIVLQAIESMGFVSDARILALNSYENRVYQVGIEAPISDLEPEPPANYDSRELKPDPVISKFYRPNRWTDEQILEEHQFSLELEAMEIPAVPPLVIKQAAHSHEDNSFNTLFRFGGYRFALFTRHGGRAPELSVPENLYWLGKYIGRIHAVGKIARFKYRPAFSVESFVIDPSAYILKNNFIPFEFTLSYKSIIANLLEYIDANFRPENFNFIRLHGDCHPGNILWTDQGPHFVDFDDCRSGPAIQDLWMLLSGEQHEQQLQINKILQGYEQFCDFDYRELQLIEVLRTMRIIHYAGWLAKRWDDPAFPLAFPWFNTPTYWGEHILQLKEQLAALQEPCLQLQDIL